MALKRLRLIQRRKALGYTQESLAEQVGWAASLALLTGSPPGVGTDEVNELEQAVTLFRRWDASGVGGLRRKAVVGQLNAIAATTTGPS